MKTTKEIRKDISRYLSKVQSRIGDRSKEEQEELLQNLEDHIFELLAQRSKEEPDRSDLESVLNEMDPPESYGNPEKSGEKKHGLRALLSMTIGQWALAMLVVGICLFLILFLVGLLASSDVLLRIGVIFGAIPVISALVLGLFGWKETAGKIAVVGSIIAVLITLMFIPARGTRSQPEPEITPQRYGSEL
jgi:hypothetical protein